MVEPVLGVFEEILAIWHSTRCTGCGHVDENGVKCVGCGNPTGDPAPVIRVGQLVLDRAGFHPTLTVESRPMVDEPRHFTDDELIERIDADIARFTEMRDHIKRARELESYDDADPARLLPVATDAVLIDDGFEVPEDDASADASAPESAASEPADAWAIPLLELTKDDAK